MEEQLTTVQKLIDTLIEFCVNYSFQVVGALIVLVIGLMIANWVSGLLMAIFEKRKFDITLSRFLTGIVRVLILGFAVLISLGKFGITITPFIAALGAIAFGATYAIQGPLSNYGAGIGIILGRPFVVGDTITVKEVSGVVDEVKLACTILVNEDGVRITVPNKQIVGEVLYNSKKNKVVEAVVGISYDNDPEAAIKIVRGVLSRFPEVVSENPGPHVGIGEFADSSINIAFRYWVPTVKFFQISHAVNLAVYKAFAEGGIKIPYPQRDLHLVSLAPGVSAAGFSQVKA